MQVITGVAFETVREPQIEVVRSTDGIHGTLSITTTRAPEFIDITDAVADIVKSGRLRAGLAVVSSQHTTASIKINENEPELIRDMEQFLSTIAPPDDYYRHNDFSIRTVNIEEDECPNAHSHCQHLLLNASETVPVSEGEMMLGKWQRIFLVELDRPRTRRIVISLIGQFN